MANFTHFSVDELAKLDHEYFGHWLNAGPAEYDQLPDDRARLMYVLDKINKFRVAIGTADD